MDNQDKIDAAAKALNKAAAAFKDALDQNAKPGTGYTQANILANIKKWLDENESNSNYAYSKSMQPLTVEMHGTNCISLPQIATDIKINVAEEKANVYLEWSIGDPNYAYAELKTENNQQYVWLNGKNDVPRDLSLTVKATTYQDANGNTVTLNEQVEAYNNLIVGAPITRYPNTSGNTYVDVDELISGKKQTFWIRIPLRYNSEKIESIDVKQAAAQCSDGSLTGSIAVDSVLSDITDQRGLYAKAVAWAVENGITVGTGAETFSPNESCTRAQAVTFLARALNAKASGKAAFSDVPSGSYYADAVAWAAESGVTTGTSADAFSPDDVCTRGQIVTFLWRAYSK